MFSIAAMASLVETPRREPATGQYSCAACNGARVLDKERYHRLTETPGPLFISPSQRSPAEKAATPSYIFSVTGKNRRREQERKRRQDAEKVEGRRKRSKKPEAVVADSDDSNGDDEDQGVNLDDEERAVINKDDSSDGDRDHGCTDAVSTL